MAIEWPDTTQQQKCDADFIAAANPQTILSLISELERAREALKFYATYSPRQHPEGYYEIHAAPGEGGEVRFGTKARQTLEQMKVK